MGCIAVLPYSGRGTVRVRCIAQYSSCIAKYSKIRIQPFVQGSRSEENRVAMALPTTVAELLQRNNLQQFAAAFEEEGFDDLPALLRLTEANCVERERLPG